MAEMSRIWPFPFAAFQPGPKPMKDHLPPSAPMRTYFFGEDLERFDDRADEMAAYGEPDELAAPLPVRAWVLLGLALLAWVILLGAVYVSMVMV